MFSSLGLPTSLQQSGQLNTPQLQIQERLQPDWKVVRQLLSGYSHSAHLFVSSPLTNSPLNNRSNSRLPSLSLDLLIEMAHLHEKILFWSGSYVFKCFFFSHDGHKKFGDHFQKGWGQKQTLALSKQKAKPISLNNSLTVTAKTKSPFTSMSKQYLVSTIKRKEKETYLCSLRQTSTIQRQHESSPWIKLNSFQMITELLFSTKQWTQ